MKEFIKKILFSTKSKKVWELYQGIASEVNYRAAMLSIRDPECLERISRNSLLKYYGNIYSQMGQDGILAEIFNRLNIHEGTFVEFGAWDGIYYSNCRRLFELGWSGVYIEGSLDRYTLLKKNYERYKNIKVINEFVGTKNNINGFNNLRSILESNSIDVSKIRFISIDVDGMDLEIFEIIECKPEVILIEGGFNFSWKIEHEFPLKYARDNIQQPLSVIIKKAEKHGYIPVCFYQDVYLVREDINCFPKLSASELFIDAWNNATHSVKQGILSLREGSKEIQEFEKKHLGNYENDPNKY